MKKWALIAAGFGALAGCVIYTERSIANLPELLVIILNGPGLLLLAPILFLTDKAISDYALMSLPIANALAYWLLVTQGHRPLTRRWGRTAISVAVSLALVGVAGFGLHRYRQNLDDDIDASWNPTSRMFDWGPGAVVVPEGFTYEEEQGIDSLVGKFVSADGKFTIEFDIGELAGQHGGGRGSIETLRDGSRVFEGRLRDNDGVFPKVSFPDNGCANFWAFTVEEPRLKALDTLARSFQPHNQLPAWIQPWLPNWIRYECRIGSWF